MIPFGGHWGEAILLPGFRVLVVTTRGERGLRSLVASAAAYRSLFYFATIESLRGANLARRHASPSSKPAGSPFMSPSSMPVASGEAKPRPTDAWPVPSAVGRG